MGTYTLEHRYLIWNDDHGERIEVGEDGDALGLVEIRCVGDDGIIITRITMGPEAVPLLIEALQNLQEFLAKRGPL